MNALWVLGGLTLAGAIVALVVSWRRNSDRTPDLGAVSTQWLSEQRLGSGQDSHR